MIPLVPALALAGLGLLLLGVLSRRPAAVAVGAVALSFLIGGRPLPGLPIDVVQLATAAAVFSVGLHWVRSGRPVAPASPVLVAAALAVLTALLATGRAVDQAAAVRLDLGYLAGLALAVAVVAACPDQRSVRLVAVLTCAGGALACSTGLGSASALRAQYGGALVQNRAVGVFSQPNELGGFAAAVLMVSLALLVGGRGGHPASRVVAGLAAATSAAALALSLSRGAWIGTFIGTGVLLVLLAATGRRRLLAGLALTVAAVVGAAAALPGQPLVSVVLERFGSLASGQRNPYDQRPAIWREALRQLAGSPLLGVGPGGYPVRAEQAGPLRVAAPDHAHSLVLTVGAEQGLLGVAALLGVVLAGIVAVVRARRAAAAALAALLGQGLVDYPLRNAVLSTLLWLLVGLLAAAAGRAQLLTVRRPASTGLAVKS